MENTENVETLADLPILLCESARAWEDWLAAHHEQPRGVWLKIAKKGTGIASVTYAEALDAALCYGWIDGQKQAHNGEFFLQRFTPRRPRSVWSRVNAAKAEQLIAAGRMAPAGLREVESARQDGRWQAAYASASTQTVPDDLRAELEQNPKAKAFFETLNKTNRYAICYRIETARKPETRRSRLEKYVAMLEAGEKLHP